MGNHSPCLPREQFLKQLDEKRRKFFQKAVTLVSPTLGKGVGGIENAF